MDVWCNCDHDDSSKTHLLRVWELAVRGLKAVIVEYMNTDTHMLFTEIILSRLRLLSVGLCSGWRVCLFCHYTTAALQLSSCYIWIHTGRPLTLHFHLELSTKRKKEVRLPLEM